MPAVRPSTAPETPAMTRPSRPFLLALAPLLVAGGGLLAFLAMIPEVRAAFLGAPIADPRPAEDPRRDDDRQKTYTVDVTDYAEAPDRDTLLVDDRLEDKITKFDPALADRRPMEGWLVNDSAAVFRLDVPIVKPDQNPERLVLRRSYAEAVKAAGGSILPSVNLIDGKAKQFDDGLYAAIDQALYTGHGEAIRGHLALVKRIRAKVTPGTRADDYLAAGLVLSGEPVEASPGARSMAEGFASQEVFSKPIGVYTWTKPLSAEFRVLRFFSRPIDEAPIAAELARVFREDEALKAEYEKAIGLYGKLTNPLVGRTPASLREGEKPARVSLFPPSSSKEGDLIAKLFPMGLPEGADLMRELVTAIRSGKVDLRPREDGGWYDHQVHALETLLLPEKGAEANKLLLTRRYKKRMLEAFKALMTKRRETHVRQLDMPPPAAAAAPPAGLRWLAPRLRVEPNPTYYLRTARSYEFLRNVLIASLGEATLKSLHGLREKGEREPDLLAELATMRDLFYGLHLLSAEDIGMAPALLEGETADRATCEKVATEWLGRYRTDPDLAADTRVSVPVYYDPMRKVTRLWMTVGVRLAQLDVTYARGPQVKPENGSKDWEPFDSNKLVGASYLIPVDEFAEVEIRGGRVLTRDDLRAVCDRMKTKERIVEALRSR